MKSTLALSGCEILNSPIKLYLFATIKKTKDLPVTLIGGNDGLKLFSDDTGVKFNIDSDKNAVTFQIKRVL
jgi:hypothetical protein